MKELWKSDWVMLGKLEDDMLTHTYGGPQGAAANKCILVQTNICRSKQIYIDAKRIKHYVKLINVAAN